MAKNFVQDGNVLELAAPYDVASGVGALIGTGLFGVAQETLLSGVVGMFAMEGVWTLAKATGVAWAVGDKLYWDNAAKVCNKTASGNTLVGVCVAAAASGDATGTIRLGIVA